MGNARPKYKVLVLGAGPAGTGLLYNAINNNTIDSLLSEGIAFVDKGEDFGRGSIGRYMINSDTASSVFLECLRSFSPAREGRLKKLISVFSRRGQAPVPLEWAGDYLGLMGRELRRLIDEKENCRFYPGTEAVHTAIQKDGSFLTMLKDGEGTFEIASETLVFAMGGKQDQAALLNNQVNGIPLSLFSEKIIGTDRLFTRQGLAGAKEKLSGGNSRVVIIGGSHSAFSSVNLLLNRAREINFGENDITLVHRSRLKLFYPSREEALCEGYTDFSDDEICPLTKKVHRLSGLRLESRDLLRKLLGLTGEKEPRVTLAHLENLCENEVRRRFEDAALIVPAFGYKPAYVPVFRDGERLTLSAESRGILVNRHCQATDFTGQPVPGLYGVGLASGFVPWGKLGGEPGFVGQTNGLWLYQNGIGEMILDQLLSSEKKKTGAELSAA